MVLSRRVTSARGPDTVFQQCLGEFVTGYEVSGWYGVGAPKGTPVEVIDELNKEINASLAPN
jgi:Tripartite tricarboxylate transporter family receptor